jgi:calcium-translocating P-type ATPase
MTHFFALLLWVAAALAFVAGMPELAVAIIVVVLINGAFAFLQEHRAERAAARLHQLLPRRARVVRDGAVVEVDAAELVVGDVMALDAGSRISADAELTSVHGVGVDTSVLSGESAPTWPTAGERVFAGTFVVEGEAEATVTHTGMNTRLASIAELTHRAHRPRTPLTIELNRVVQTIATIAISVGSAFFALVWLVGTGARDGFLFAVGVAVALVPEGLLPTVTLSLARGAQRMAGRRALVRRLESVETLGSTTFICTDKTGTLTRNEMAVVQVWTPAGSAAVKGDGYEPRGDVDVAPSARDALVRLATAAARCSTGRAVMKDGAWVAEGDPMEAALHVLAARVGVDVELDERERPTTGRAPFDPRRRRMAVGVGDELLVKGAPESVLPLCSSSNVAEEAVPELAARGLRVLAIAARPLDVGEPVSRTAERDLTLLGLVGLEDPPRAEARTAVEACRAAGIKVALITGDHPATALGIAREVGLLGAEERAIDGAELPNDDQVLGAMLDNDGLVVSRVAPEDKLRITRALQARGHVVAMTGDGVNDGPALQQADIGVAMGRSGTDVAREASDLVLLDDNFATIVEAVAEGRATFSNIRRFLTYHLTDNVAELTPFVIWAISGGRYPLALGVLQILCLDIGTDLLPALALGAESPAPDVLRRGPGGRHLVDAALLRRVFGVLGAAEAAVEMTAFTVALLLIGWRPDGPAPSATDLATASGAAFSAVVFGQMANAFACRSARVPAWRLGWTTNRLLVGAVLTELVFLAGFLFIEPVANALDHAPPAPLPALVALLAAPAVLIADAVHKSARRAVEPSARTGGTSGPAAASPTSRS